MDSRARARQWRTPRERALARLRRSLKSGLELDQYGAVNNSQVELRITSACRSLLNRCTAEQLAVIAGDGEPEWLGFEEMADAFLQAAPPEKRGGTKTAPLDVFIKAHRAEINAKVIQILEASGIQGFGRALCFE